MITQQKQLFKILELPKHLQTTIGALLRLGVATASDISRVTGKARAVESAYLNQFVTMRIAFKERIGRKAFFIVNLEALE